MSYGNQSCLRFSLEESVWFQKGQEVAELISISLDPNITIQESDQYVTIKGSLELSGEFNRFNSEAEEENDLFTSSKFIQFVEEREGNVCVFTHEFPVEITIPQNRIQNLFEIDVAVETFDYAFPERSCLKLTADLMITGLYGEQQHEQHHAVIQDSEIIELEPIRSPYSFEEDRRDEVEEEEQSVEIPIYTSSPFEKPPIQEDENEDLYKPFVVEARKEPEEISEDNNQIESMLQAAERESIEKDSLQDIVTVVPESNLDPEPVVEKEALQESFREEPFVKEEEEEEERTESIWGEKQSIDSVVLEQEKKEEKTPEITFSAIRNEKEKEVNLEEFLPDQGAEETPEVLLENMEQQEVSANAEEEESSSSSPEDKIKKNIKKSINKLKHKETLTLTEFFARKEEEAHTKVKICIVQHGDTLDKLAERYDVSVVNLQRVNQLELNQDVYEGQVLYIPIPVGQN